MRIIESPCAEDFMVIILTFIFINLWTKASRQIVSIFFSSMVGCGNLLLVQQKNPMTSVYCKKYPKKNKHIKQFTIDLVKIVEQSFVSKCDTEKVIDVSRVKSTLFEAAPRYVLLTPPLLQIFRLQVEGKTILFYNKIYLNLQIEIHPFHCIFINK